MTDLNPRTGRPGSRMSHPGPVSTAPVEVSRADQIAEVIARLGDGDFTKSGKPKVAAINARLAAFPVTTSERDAIWESMNG